ncbi:MAG TPA: iron-containing alcohol dehydrogenase [Firmicutes bacterium]|nr:iron-containing alcohol dehydrogenase [Bacillota bacterium]
MTVTSRRAGLTQKLVAQLAEAGARAVLYEEASPNPTTVEVDAGAELARREGVEALVGLGGGSAMDVAKAIAMVVAYGQPCYELCGRPLPQPGLPVVAVPTTSGTGAEVSGVAVVTEPSRHHKTSLRSPQVSPAVAAVDPELTLALPPSVTASSGMDAFQS